MVDSLAGTITLGHDSLDRVLSEATPNGTVTYTYDTSGRRQTMTVPGQASVSYGWDNADRLQTITQGSNVVDFDYDNANRRTKLTYPSGTSTEYAYDTASRLTGLTYKHGGNTLGALTYTYDVASQRTRVGGSWARTGLPAAVASATYNAANHQTAFGGQTLTYDLNGNLTGDGMNTYTWNARNQLASLTGPIAGSFVYDAFGRRQRKTVDGTITDFVYDGLNPVREAVGANTVDLLTGLGIDEYLTRTDSSSTRDLLSDALGSTVGLGDGAGAVPTEYSYEPFGAVTTSGTTSTNEFRYTGREDDGTGLNYYRARYYHPGLQRFITEDPIGFGGGDINFYAYVFNDPLNFRDPDGLSPVGDFLRGAVTYVEGICGTFRYSARVYGLLGDEERLRAQAEGLIVAEVLHQLSVSRGARQLGVSAAFYGFARSARTEPFRVLGRATAAAQVTQGLNSAAPVYGGLLGVALGGAALHGNVRLTIERGGHSLDELIDAMVRGEVPTGLSGRKSNFCGA